MLQNIAKAAADKVSETELVQHVHVDADLISQGRHKEINYGYYIVLINNISSALDEYM